MNSSSLKEKGFSEPLHLKGLQFASIPLEENCVLVLTDITFMGKPTSDILYIGKSKKPTKRIFGGYIAGYGGKTTRKIHSKLFNDGFIEKVAVCWMPTSNPKASQKELLEGFKKEHGEYPLWNITKKPQAKPKKAASKIVKPKAPKKKVKTATS